MSAYELHCTVCKNSFSGRGSWLRHLVDRDHQKSASLEISEWDKKLKKCALVAFSSCPMVACALELLEYLSKGVDIVTDFVFIPEQSYVGILQFESKDKVNEIMMKLKNEDFQVEINAKKIQFRKVISYMDLEWNLLLPKVNILKLKLRIGFEEKQEEILSSQNRKHSLNKEPPFSLKRSKNSKLREEFDSLCKIVKIPDEEFDAVGSLVSNLKIAFRAHTSYKHCEVYLFRNWYLQLKSGGSNELLIFVDFNGELTTGKWDKGLAQNRPNMENILASKHLSYSLQIEKSNEKLGDTAPSIQAIAYKYIPLDLNFFLISHPWLLIEVQTCRLVSYMCLFDNRVKPLLSLIFYWSGTNKIFMQDNRCKELDSSPYPSALEWFVMLFLSYQKIIPSPREVQNVKNISVMKREVDIGFTINEDFVKSWKSSKTSGAPDENCDHFIKDVLALAADFFAFYAKMNCKSWILNCKDGEILDARGLFGKDTQWHSNLTVKEIHVLRQVLKDNNANINKHSSVTLLHPLYFKHGFSFPSKTFIHSICPLMKCTEEKILEFLSSYTNEGSIFQVFKVSE